MDVAYLATRESHEYLRTVSRVGRRLPAHTRTTCASLAEGLAAVRVRGYAVDREEGVPGIVGFGFALRTDTPAADAISCSVPVARLTPEQEERIVTVMREIRTKIEVTTPGAAGGAPAWR